MPIHSGQTSRLHSNNERLRTCGDVDDSLLSRQEIKLAIKSMLDRMVYIDSICIDSFPLYAPANTGQWKTSSGGSWIGGFWSGWWWLRAYITNSISDRVKANDLCRRLSSKMPVDSINRSFIFWFGAAPGSHWFGDKYAQALERESISAITATYNAELRCFPLGKAMGGGENGNQCISLDSFAALVQLLGNSEVEQDRNMLRDHVDTLLETCFEPQGAFHASADYSQGKFVTSDNAGAWSRGQAWGMLGLCRAAARWQEPYVTHAQTACEYWRNSRTDILPLNRLDSPNGLLDPSSAVIAALAMISLADLIPDGSLWRLNAHRMITDVVRSQYFLGCQATEVQEENPTVDSGIFRGCCYGTRPGQEELAETPWGSFFLMAALCTLAQIIRPDDV